MRIAVERMGPTRHAGREVGRRLGSDRRSPSVAGGRVRKVLSQNGLPRTNSEVTELTASEEGAAVMTDSIVASSTGGDGTRKGLPRLVDIGTVARHLGVTVRHVRRLVAERRIPFVKWGHLLRFDLEEINQWLDAARVQVPILGDPTIGTPAAPRSKATPGRSSAARR